MVMPKDDMRRELEAQGVSFAALDDALKDLARDVMRAGATQVCLQGRRLSARQKRVAVYGYPCSVSALDFVMCNLPCRAAQIGEWPRSRAVYGLDVILAKPPSSRTNEHAPALGCVPQLLEVNSGPDFVRMSGLYGSFVNDVFSALLAADDAGTGVPNTLSPL